MRWLTIGILSLAACFATAARGDIYQWEYIDPLQPELGRQQSSTLAPDGAGQIRRSRCASLRNLDLTMAWLADKNLLGAEFRGVESIQGRSEQREPFRSFVRGADLSDADLSGTFLDRPNSENHTDQRRLHRRGGSRGEF